MLGRAEGFSLIEVLVSFVIVALALSQLVPMTLDSMNRSDRAVAVRTAVGYAEAVLARLGHDIPLRQGIQSGDYDRQYRWTVHIAPVGAPAADSYSDTVAYQVGVTVAWGAPSRPQTVSLDTVRLGPKT